jgi:hypothetical protein
MQQFRYVLIDSRTGVTDTSGICTRLMPEKLVVVFAPNAQNLDGLQDVVRRAVNHRRNSSDVCRAAEFSDSTGQGSSRRSQGRGPGRHHAASPAACAPQHGVSDRILAEHGETRRA